MVWIAEGRGLNHQTTGSPISKLSSDKNSYGLGFVAESTIQACGRSSKIPEVITEFNTISEKKVAFLE